ncbi:MAG: helix-turn-helix transcriptional regulator [Clostridia bacterium]|nr:helix-turn-helix transcriptional regulator [Clostridia bacterium]
MNNALLTLYQHIRETPALSVDLPEEYGKGRIERLETNTFSLSSWNLMFSKDTYVEGSVPEDMRLLFCTGDGVEWATKRGKMRLDRCEACFCRPYGAPEKMCYQSSSPFSFLSVAIPMDRFADLIGSYIQEPDKAMDHVFGRRFAISSVIRKSIQDIGPLGSIHGGLEMMRLEARLLECLSLSLQAALCEPAGKRQLHQDDLKVIHAIGKRIEEDPAMIPGIAALAHDYCMSVSKLTRCFRQVYGTSLHAYVIEARLQKGAELLTHGRISIREVAEKVGYAKPSQFSADFRRRFGVLPGDYGSGV